MKSGELKSLEFEITALIADSETGKLSTEKLVIKKSDASNLTADEMALLFRTIMFWFTFANETIDSCVKDPYNK